MNPNQRRTRKIDLIIMGLVGAGIGVVVLTDCEETSRNVYKSREGCVDDYSAGQCLPYREADKGYYRGPEYYTKASVRRSHPDDSGPGRFFERFKHLPADVVHTETAQRGGFGCHGRRFFSGS